MMYPYIKLDDGTEIIHSDILHEDNKDKVLVHFERPVDNASGFDDARCELPDYRWISISGFSDAEIAFFTEFLNNNAHLIYKYARCGGIKIA